MGVRRIHLFQQPTAPVSVGTALELQCRCQWQLGLAYTADFTADRRATIFGTPRNTSDYTDSKTESFDMKYFCLHCTANTYDEIVT